MEDAAACGDCSSHFAHNASATGCHSRCAALVATWNAIVATGGQHGASATEAQTRPDPATRTYRRTPDGAKLWFQDFHAYQERVHSKSLAYNIRQAKHLVPELSGPWHPTHSADGMMAAHLTTAADHPWTCHHSPFRISRTSHMPSLNRLSLSVPTWHHVYRRVLRELDIEFEPTGHWDAAVSSEPAALMETRGDLHAQQAERG